MDGGKVVADVLRAQGVRFLFTLTGRHIAPILVGCKQTGIRVIDTRHEVNAVFAADAMARLTGIPGVAAVAAGPSLTNTITAVKNAQLAQSPLVLLGGAAQRLTQEQGKHQENVQLSLRSTVKWARRVRRVKEIVPVLEQAFQEAVNGLPGPVFVELPLDVLYNEAIVREWHRQRAPGSGLAAQLRQQLFRLQVRRLFAQPQELTLAAPVQAQLTRPDLKKVGQIAEKLMEAERPLLLVGSQALLAVRALQEVAAAIDKLGIPVYLSGMARGLLGREHRLLQRHHLVQAIRESDFLLVAGLAALDGVQHLSRKAIYVHANRGRSALSGPRRPHIGMLGDPGLVLRQLAVEVPGGQQWEPWQTTLHERDQTQSDQIRQRAGTQSGQINPLQLLHEIDAILPPQAILIVDGGEFAASAALVLRPPGPHSWLESGPFQAAGVGAGFALGVKLARPDAEVWILYGDGSAGYSLTEYDSLVRHEVPVIGLVGNDGGRTQAAREQISLLQDDVATVLAHTDYHRVAAGFGAAGLKAVVPEEIPAVLARAQTLAAGGQPVLVNAIVGRSDLPGRS